MTKCHGASYSLLSDAPSWLSIDTLSGELSTSTTPTNAEVGNYTFTVRVDDGYSYSDQAFTLTVDNVAPAITSVAGTTFTEDAGVQTFDVNSTDEGQGSTYSLVGAPTGVTIDGTTGVMSADPTNALVGTHTFTVRVNDGTVDVDQNFTLTVDNVAPDITTADTAHVTEDGGIQYVDVDSDDEGIGATYSLIGAPTWVTIDATSGVISVDSPTNDDVGDHAFTVRADDGHSVTDQAFHPDRRQRGTGDHFRCRHNLYRGCGRSDL